MVDVGWVDCQQYELMMGAVRAFMVNTVSVSGVDKYE